MRTVADIVADFTAVVADVPAAVQAQKAKGKKIVGVFPVYTPEELVYAAGMFPVGCWGGQVNIAQATQLLPPFACPVMQAITEHCMSGTYDMLDGAILSDPCDTLKCLTQNFTLTNPKVKVMYCLYPQNNQLEGGRQYIYNEFKRLGKELGELSGQPITETALKQSIAIYNENRGVMTELAGILAQKPGVLTPSQRHDVMKARWFMDKKDNTALVQELNEALRAAKVTNKNAKKIVLSGIMTEPAGLVEVLDELGYAVVADELAYESRQFRNPVPDGIDQYDRLARQWQNVKGCSLVWDPDSSRGKNIVSMAQETGADGVLYCQMKFCEVEEFDYPYIAQMLGKVDVPHLNLEIDPLSGSQEQARTRLQAFGEQLEARG